MNMEQINKQPVVSVNGRMVTRGELHAAFTKVQNPEGWKMPIDWTGELASLDELLVLEKAVIFFTASQMAYEKLADGRFHVTADGYYRAVGA